MNQQAHHAEELRLQQDIEEALERASEGKANEDDIKLLAWASGVRCPKQKEMHK